MLDTFSSAFGDENSLLIPKSGRRRICLGRSKETLLAGYLLRAVLLEIGLGSAGELFIPARFKSWRPCRMSN